MPRRRKFIEIARELGCDEGVKAFDAALKKVAKAKAAGPERKPDKGKKDR